MPSTTTPAPSRLPALDALRAVGAAAVVGTHVGFATGATGATAFGGLLARMDVGVAIFFALSGFLLFRPFAYAAATGTRRPGARRYLWRRALRILPAYWLTVLVCLAVLPGNADAPRADWLRFATLTQIYAPINQESMSLVRQIVEAHGGTVDFRTSVGEGTTFRIRLKTV